MYQVDAFTDRLFAGNPAAVCMLDEPLPAKLMQSIAAENNLSETAFVQLRGDHYHIRWFTPAAEVDLCGHATLASAWVIFNILKHPLPEIRFESKSGLLRVTHEENILFLDFPSDTLKKVEDVSLLEGCINFPIKELYKGKWDYMVVLKNETEIVRLQANMEAIAKLKSRGLIVTAPGDKVDFVSRFFAPQLNVPEDPVTGSAHTTLVPYWAERLGKSMLTARQLSTRGGSLICIFRDDRCQIGGEACLYMVAEIMV